ncbi:glycosyltransferase [Actinomycetospora sp. NBRC 106375]|uniref:glycosyltransferase n=1 Tax=Actinomycetospora sp. NBRC 106375 TaxID=3032207 RepID=UPI0025533CA3|nr:glycosyltransferase [Actinomycetospora sp. NBRC 106375]
MPNLRSSVVEEMPATQEALFTSALGDADPALLADPRVRPFTWRRLLAALRDPELALLEVAEPLWAGEWVRALRAVALVKVLRRDVAVATYAIENLDARERLGSRRRALAVGASMLTLDAVAFGTSGAATNYRRAFGWSLRRTEHAVLPPRLGDCRVCGPGDAERDRTVLFLGAPSDRKGFGVLLDAWTRCGAADRGWRLVVADPSGAVERAVPPGVSITSPTRAAVHDLLRRAAVVALPSVRRPGWREQIGLPLVEGLAHGCRVVTTTETGLADDLRGHALVTLTTPGDPGSLADGLARAMGGGSHDVAETYPSGGAGYAKSDVVAWWLQATGAAGVTAPARR